jgi:hypothetical protein
MYVKIQNWDVTNENFRILMSVFYFPPFEIYSGYIDIISYSFDDTPFFALFFRRVQAIQINNIIKNYNAVG